MTTIDLNYDTPSGCWMATWKGEGAEGVRRAFGVVTVPTPFFDPEDRDRVLETVCRLNPECVVSIAEPEGRAVR